MIPKKRNLRAILPLYSSRAQSLSFNAVVLIILALLVLVVIGTIFLVQTGKSTCELDEFNKEIDCNKECASKSSLGDAVFTECVRSCKVTFCDEKD